ncbi:hypothetical protein HCX49_05865 [Sphingobacterium kitahiroshimense]|uniref:hypothetical protein n=1 Tax=Sphingobacterium sp. B16(2022) TaxID=2914044 RepID=UPI001438CFA6|nr:hypothetical protein [Sphingobacterium sp. B16(2022)]NJI72725.1 hypothetical protein [Sphingobacterium sp. B16(2022)]
MSKILNEAINIILYDDDKSYAESLMITARRRRVLIKWVDNVQDLFIELENKPKKYVFVILDARAYSEPGQKKGEEDEMNLIDIFSRFSNLKSEKNIIIPFCINTGFAELKTKIAKYKIECPIFDKGSEEALLDYIIKGFNNSDLGKLLYEFPDIFKFCSRHFDESDFAVIFKLFDKGKFQATEIADRISTLASLRRITEHLGDKIYDLYLGKHGPTISSPASRVKDIFYYLHNNKDIPSHLYFFVLNVHGVGSSYGSHTPENASKESDYPSIFFISGLALGLNDLFRWAAGKIN